MECSLVILSFIPVIFFCIGIPLWAVGLKSTHDKVSSLFTILPLYPNGTFPYDTYYIVQKENSSAISKVINITIDINDKQVKNREVYMLHNMWGYNINADLIINNQRIKQISISNNNNYNYSDKYVPLTRHSLYELPRLRSSFENIQFYDNVFSVFCPYSTDLTLSVQSFCSHSQYPMLIDGNYSLDNLFSSLSKYSFKSLTIEFHNSYLIPYNYAETPEAYIIFIRDSQKNSMLYAGISLTVIGIILTFVYFFIICIVSCC